METGEGSWKRGVKNKGRESVRRKKWKKKEDEDEERS